jgi:hypothetical protein
MIDLTTAESVARRYASSRPGCNFIGAQEVGIAIFVLDLQVVVVEAKDLSPIDEFLLRSLELGIDREDQLTHFLGLDQRTVRDRLIELSRSELVVGNPSKPEESTWCR